MSAPKWTPAQRAAIEDRGGTLLVSAAAGSDKTAVLVERAVRLITDAAHPVAADRLLIVTTRAAAARAHRGTACGRGGRAPRAYLRRQRLLLGARQHFVPSTHSVCSCSALFRGAGAAGF